MNKTVRALGLDVVQFARCMATGTALEKIKAEQAEGVRLGVTGTPTLFVGVVDRHDTVSLMKKIRGAVSPAVIAEALSGL